MASDSNPPQRKPQTKAIALAYDPFLDALPRVVASGKGGIAEQILRIAFEHKVKVRQDKTLTEMLSLLEIESEIPVATIVAVAEILSYVYRENGKIKQLHEAQRQAKE